MGKGEGGEADEMGRLGFFGWGEAVCCANDKGARRDGVKPRGKGFTSVRGAGWIECNVGRRECERFGDVPID